MEVTPIFHLRLPPAWSLAVVPLALYAPISLCPADLASPTQLYPRAASCSLLHLRL